MSVSQRKPKYQGMVRRRYRRKVSVNRAEILALAEMYGQFAKNWISGAYSERCEREAKRYAVMAARCAGQIINADDPAFAVPDQEGQ